MSDKVPEGWGNYELQKLVQNYKGSMVDGPFGSNLKTSDYVSSGVPVLQGKNVTNDRFVWSDVRYITFEKAEELKRSSVRVGDILMVKIGSVGYSAIVEDLNGFDYAIIPANLLKISLDEEKSLTQFVYQFLISPEGKRRIVDAASSTAQPALSLGAMKKFKIPTPPLPEQQKITSILTSVDEVIETIQKYIYKLQDLKKATMNELLTKGIGHTEFKDSELGRIPKSWEVVELGELSDVTKLAGFEYTEHFDYSIGGEIIALRALNLDSGKLDLTNIQTIPKSVSDALPRSKLFYGDILISYVGSVGDLGFIYDNDRFHLAPNVAKISCNLSKVNAQFILQQLLSARAQKNIEDLTTITSQPSLNMANIRKIRLLVCPLSEQDKIVEVLSSLDIKTDNLRNKLSKTQFLKKSLMQVLLTGKVRVKVN